MRALAKTNPGEGLELVDILDPEPGPGETLIEVELASLCGADLEIKSWEGAFPEWMRAHLPVVVGHEFSGRIVAVGPGIAPELLGRRVAVDPGHTCNHCVYCRTARPNLCRDRSVLGIVRDGAFTKFVVVPIECCYFVPDAMDPESATLLESFGVACHAYRVAGIAGGQNVAVIGPGPIGLAVLAQVCAFGNVGTVFGRQSDRHVRFGVADSLGASACVDVDEAVGASAIDDMAGSFDVVFCTAPAAGVTAQAMVLVRSGGAIVSVGVSSVSSVAVDIRRVVLDEIRILGVRGREVQDWYKSMELMRQIDLSGLRGPTYALEDFESAYESCARGEGVKVFLRGT